jgi:spore coat protein CotH
MRIVNNEDGQTFKTQIEAVFDVDTFLKCLLVYIATNNYDSVIGSGRNWYLALDKKTQKFKLIPWDNGVSLSANFPSVLQDCNIQPGFCYEKVSRRTFSFNDTSIHQGPMRRLWDLGDGTSSKSNSFTHTYSKNGNYTVCLTLSSIAECSEKVCHEINTRKKTEKCDDVLGSYYEYNFPLYLDYTNNPLISKIFTIPEFREKMRVMTCEFLETTLSVSNMNTFIEQQQFLLEKAVKFDPNLLLDYSYFEREVIDLQSPYNLRKILEQRINFLTHEANCKSY